MKKIMVLLLLALVLVGCNVTQRTGDRYYSSQQLKVKPNAYGLGVGMDQYGRPVRYSR